MRTFAHAQTLALAFPCMKNIPHYKKKMSVRHCPTQQATARVACAIDARKNIPNKTITLFFYVLGILAESSIHAGLESFTADSSGL